MTKSQKNCIKQNEKSFIQKDLSLTELWQKGELQEGFYFVSDGAEITIDYYLCDYWERHFDSDVQQVLAPVPSYEEWDKLNNTCHELEKETACLTVDIVNLKELLKECRYYIGYDTYEFDEKVNKLLTKIDEVLK